MSAKVGTKANPCTLENSSIDEIYGKYCRCEKCGCVERCFGSFDFYRTEDDRFLCEHCFRDWLEGLGISTSGLPPVAPKKLPN